MTQYAEDFEEGQACPFMDAKDETVPCAGTLEFGEVENCSCHISAPCSGHTEQKLACTVCGWEVEDVD